MHIYKWVYCIFAFASLHTGALGRGWQRKTWIDWIHFDFLFDSWIINWNSFSALFWLVFCSVLLFFFFFCFSFCIQDFWHLHMYNQILTFSNGDEIKKIEMGNGRCLDVYGHRFGQQNLFIYTRDFSKLISVTFHIPSPSFLMLFRFETEGDGTGWELVADE